jgi:quercetin dioxygenase-like cupin family protein
VVLGAALSQQAGTQMNGYETLLVEATIEPGVAVGRHTHPGIESAYVMEGGFELPVQGQPTRVLKVGDAFQIPPQTPMRVERLATPRPEFLSPMLWKRENPSHLQPDHLRVGRSFVCRVVLADHLAGRVCAQRCLEFVIANSPARGRRRDDESDHGNRPATANVAGEAAQLPTSHELPPAAARTVPNSADRTSAIGERGGADLAFGLTGYVDNLRTDMPKRGRDLPLNS